MPPVIEAEKRFFFEGIGQVSANGGLFRCSVYASFVPTAGRTYQVSVMGGLGANGNAPCYIHMVETATGSLPATFAQPAGVPKTCIF